jgi:uncharacterized membrane protein YfcA
MLDLPVTLAGLFVGLIVGMTGMGGGALMTPILILLFGVQPLAAVSSDLVASMVMKPLGAAVHIKRKTVHHRLVLWLVLGSVPAAFLGVLILQHNAAGADLQHWVKRALGGALLLIATTLLARPFFSRSRRPAATPHELVVRPIPTLIIGMIGGLVVGLTSVGSGSLIMLMLLLSYPTIRLSELVGTDLVQAVPLVAAAALAHILFGDFHLGITASILVGSLPGIYIGARFSSRASDRVIRPLLVVVLVASALKLLGAEDMVALLLSAMIAVAAIIHFVSTSQRGSQTETATRA